MPPPLDDSTLENGHWDEKPDEKPDWEIESDWRPATLQTRNVSRDFSQNLHTLASRLNTLSRPWVHRFQSSSWAKTVAPGVSSPGGGAPVQLRRTAYLDGLRGFAAFMVYWHHHQLWAHEAGAGNAIMENAFGYVDRYAFCALPYVRTFFTGGHFAVTVFFVISGYVLSAKPLSLVQSGEYVKLGDNVGSALFRRWLRLYIPVAATTLCYLTFYHVFHLWTSEGTREQTFRAELRTWYLEFKNFSYIFNMGGDPWFSYNFHSWSIPVEMKGSIVIYTSVLAFSRCTRNMRLSAQCFLIFYFMFIVDGWSNALFVSGMLLCDLDLLAQNNDLPDWFYRLEPYKELIFFNMWLVSMYLGGVPSVNNDVTVLAASPGWRWLSILKPQAFFDYKWFYLIFAAVFLVCSIQRLPWLKVFFEHRFNQYLGRISFALYLIHGPVLWVLGDRVYAAVGFVRLGHDKGIPEWTNKFPISKAGPLGLEPAFWIPQLVLLPVTLWVANLVTMAFDETSVRFTSWLYGQTQPRFDKLQQR